MTLQPTDLRVDFLSLSVGEQLARVAEIRRDRKVSKKAVRKKKVEKGKALERAEKLTTEQLEEIIRKFKEGQGSDNK